MTGKFIIILKAIVVALPEDGYGRYIEDEIQKGDQTLHFFFINYGLGWGKWGWYCWEYHSDKDGNILKKKEYYVEKSH